MTLYNGLYEGFRKMHLMMARIDAETRCVTVYKMTIE
jgi:hypothetical protein